MNRLTGEKSGDVRGSRRRRTSRTKELLVGQLGHEHALLALVVDDAGFGVLAAFAARAVGDDLEGLFARAAGDLGPLRAEFHRLFLRGDIEDGDGIANLADEGELVAGV